MGGGSRRADLLCVLLAGHDRGRLVGGLDGRRRLCRCRGRDLGPQRLRGHRRIDVLLAQGSSRIDLSLLLRDARPVFDLCPSIGSQARVGIALESDGGRRRGVDGQRRVSHGQLVH